MSDLIQICKGDNTQITENFTVSEFYSKSADAPNCHTISNKLIQAVQLVRSVYDMPICITSTYRTQLGNALIGSNENSRHRTNEGAVDFQACNPAQNDQLIGQLYAELRDQGEVYQTLRSLGINGFGYYDDFVHFDVRPEFGSSEILTVLRWRGWIDRLQEKFAPANKCTRSKCNCTCSTKKSKKVDGK